KKAREKAEQLNQTLKELQTTQSQLIHTEKMSALGLLLAGIVHEINNPVNFINGNLQYAASYVQDLIDLIEVYQKNYGNPVAEVQDKIEEIELDFLKEDVLKLLKSMTVGVDRIRDLVLSLKIFSRTDSTEMKYVNIHEGLNSTLLILHHQLKASSDRPEIKVIKEYGNLPLVECMGGQLNQVFMNLISNSIDALEGYGNNGVKISNPQIKIKTELLGDNQVCIRIGDNGPGMNEEVRQKLFETFFTTKPVGKGTGLGLSISYQIIVEKHHGLMNCISTPGSGAEFIIVIPVKQT
ncbi:MAG TPA: ATP-binding protein, partial [Allocoleopsis sp.]